MYNEVINAIYKGENAEVLERQHYQRLALRILSFDDYNLDIASRLDRYFTKIDRSFFAVMLRRLPFKHNEEITYISKKAEKEDVLMELFKCITKLYRWSIRELDANLQVLMLLADDKEWVKTMGMKVGMTATQLKKLGIKLDKPKKKVQKTRRLTDFMGGG